MQDAGLRGAERPFAVLRATDRVGLFFAGLGTGALALPFVTLRPNRIVDGEAFGLGGAFPQGLLVAGLLVALLALAALHRPRLRLAASLAGIALLAFAAGAAPRALLPEGDRLARVSAGTGFWALLGVFLLLMTDALARLRPAPLWRLAGLALAAAATGGLLASGWLDDLSAMREYLARRASFWQEARVHLALSFGSLACALLIGLPLGVAVQRRDKARAAVMGGLTLVQTIPSLAMFGLMIPVLAWVAANVPLAAQAGVAGIGVAPALVALVIYALLPVVAATIAGLDAVPRDVAEAARGLGLTTAQRLFRVGLPLAFPVILSGVRIVLVQNIGIAVIAALIGGGGFGTFVFQGLSQTATDLVLLGALPTVALAIAAGIALDAVLDLTGGKR